jgi:phosphotriesterase-related protein
MQSLAAADATGDRRRLVIETVLGPIPAEQLGPTSMHEHVLSDASALGIPRRPGAPDADDVLDEPALAAAELGRLPAAGLRTVVDPTGWGFGGPDPRLAAVSRSSGVQIVAGVGAYLPQTRPAWLRELDEASLAAQLRAALLDRLPGCGFRAGVVGVLAPGLPLEEEDRRLLRAGGAAAAEAGAAAIVRLDPRRRDGPEILELLAAAGLPPDRVVLSNVDGYASDLVALRELAAAGATLKWCFGYESPPRPGLAGASDTERADALCDLLAAGHRRQVLACGIWTKSALHAHGGFGYDHLGVHVIPALRRRGLTDDDLEELLATQPRRLLDRP